MRFFAGWSGLVSFIIAASVLLVATTMMAEDTLSQLRDEVRTDDPPDAGSSKPTEDRRATSYDPQTDPYNSDVNPDDGWGDLILPALCVAGIAASTPFWGPPALIGDSYDAYGYSPRYPNKTRGGYMWIGEPVGDVYVLGVRARSDYGTNFGRFDWIGGTPPLEAT